MPNSGRRNSSQQSSEDYLEEKYVLPPNGLRNSMIIGGIGGFIVFFVHIGIPLLNASLFSQAARLDQNTPFQVAFLTAILGGCGIPIFDLLLVVGVGAVVGKIAVKRAMGCWAGILAGACVPLSYIISAFIPGYPGHISSGPVIIFSGAWWAGFGLVIFLIAVFALIGGLVSLLGTWITTRKHPYYR